MVRAGIVKLPSEWECSGYHELQNIPERKRRKIRINLKYISDLHRSDPILNPILKDYPEEKYTLTILTHVCLLQVGVGDAHILLDKYVIMGLFLLLCCYLLYFL